MTMAYTAEVKHFVFSCAALSFQWLRFPYTLPSLGAVFLSIDCGRSESCHCFLNWFRFGNSRNNNAKLSFCGNCIHFPPLKNTNCYSLLYAYARRKSIALNFVSKTKFYLCRRRHVLIFFYKFKICLVQFRWNSIHAKMVIDRVTYVFHYFHYY